jgi:chromosome partitioning protein
VLEARETLAGYGLPVCPVAITRREALSYALNDGRAVTEFEPTGKVAAEIKKLWTYLQETLNHD